MHNLMEAHHTATAVRTATKLGAAAKAASLPRNPALVPGFMDALGGLPAEDPIAKAVTKAYLAAYDGVPA